LRQCSTPRPSPIGTTADNCSWRPTADSIRSWLTRDELRTLMLESGFADARHVSLSTGFATVHLGVRPAD